MAKNDDQELFIDKLKAHQRKIDADITQYAKKMRKHTKEQYGEYALIETDAFLQILERGGKRLRGSLVILGYEMSGGKNDDMIIQVARVVEMAHAYFLIIDDIQDRSDERRGGPTAHKILEKYHKEQRLNGDSEHFGMSVALNAAIAGMHAAQMILANIDAAEALRLNASSIFNRTLSITAHGQTQDIVNGYLQDVNETEINNVMTWKTAHYSVLNPLHMGMVLAGADCHDTDAVTMYATNIGKAYQITDDIIGIFGEASETGKDQKSDLKEGKQTLLTWYVLTHGSHKDKEYLQSILGKNSVSDKELVRCQEIIRDSGALDHARTTVDQLLEEALTSLDASANHWSDEGVAFLRGLAQYLPTRMS